MSDPVTKLEIEDVLSSIRRLVSEDGKPKTPDKPPVDALILTPAHRVVEPVAANEPGVETPPAEVASEPPQEIEVVAVAEDMGAEANTESAEDPVDETLLASDDETLLASDDEGGEGSSKAEAGWSPDPEETAAGEDNFETLQASSLVDRVAGLEQAISDRGGEWEPDGSELEQETMASFSHWEESESFEDDLPDVVESSEEETGEAAPRAEFRHGNYGDVEESDGDPATDVDEDDTENESGEIAEEASHEAKDAEIEDFSDELDEEVPEESKAPEAAGQAVPDDDWLRSREDAQDAPTEAQEPSVAENQENQQEDHPELTVEPAPEATEETEESAAAEAEIVEPDFAAQDAREAGVAPDESLVGALNEDALLDEEILREMVREVTREELQGALGERITRNVRKLVRREVHRVLTSRDLE